MTNVQHESIPEYTERVFSYGTLQDPSVQQLLWGEIQDEAEDAELEGFRRTGYITIEPDRQSSVKGKCYWLTKEQLANTDWYEAGYIRIRVLFKDNEPAWVYVPRQHINKLKV